MMVSGESTSPSTSTYLRVQGYKLQDVLLILDLHSAGILPRHCGSHKVIIAYDARRTQKHVSFVFSESGRTCRRSCWGRAA